MEKTSSSTDIAAPIFIVESNEKINISNTNNIGYYEFLIRNFNETSISETNFSYTIEIVSDIDNKIQFELYNGENIIPLENLKTEKLSIKGQEKVEQKYTLKIIYDNSQNNSGEDLFGEVQIRICSEQEKI